MLTSPYITLTTSSPTVELDPAAPGAFVRYAFALEGTFNILGGLAMILIPSRILSYIVARPSEINHAAASLLQWVGALTLGLTPQLFIARRNTRFAIESRRMVYYTLGAGELTLLPVMLWQAWGPDSNLGLTPRALMGMFMVLLPPLLLRAYVLFVDPSLIGRYRYSQKME